MDFDHRAARSSPQSITRISLEETAILEAAKALDLSEISGDAIHLVVDGPQRHWLIRTGHGEVSASILGSGTAHSGIHLPLSDRITWFLNSLEDSEPMIALAEGTTAVITGAHTSVAIDLVPWTGPAPTPHEIIEQAAASMPLHRFAKTLAAARLMPSGMEDPHYPTPPMWLRIAEGSVVLSVDWRDFLPSGSTYTMQADDTRGTALVAIDHGRIDRFLRGLDAVIPLDEDPESLADPESVSEWARTVTISVGEEASRAMLVVSTQDWRLVLPVVDVLAERWSQQVTAQLSEYSVTEVTSASWAVSIEGCVVEVALRHGHPDQIRVSTCLATGVTDTEDLLRELSTLNAASTGERLWCAEDCLWAAVDLPCTRIEDLRQAVAQISTVADTYAPLLAALG